MVSTDELQEYLQRVTGTRPEMVPVSADEVQKIPIFLTEAWDFFDTDFIGVRMVFAVEKDADQSTTPARLERQSNLLREAFGRPVVMVLSHVSSASFSRLMGRMVPFMVVGGDIFIPFGLLLFANRKPVPPTKPRATLSAPAQLLVLMHLSGRDVQGVVLSRLASMTGYTPMTITNASRELRAVGLVEIRRTGRSMTMWFTHQGRELWEFSKDRLVSPVLRRIYARFTESRPESLLRAGMSALSDLSMIADDRVPTYAGDRKAILALVNTGKVVLMPDADEADALIEVWRYNPVVLGKDGLVDPLSLRLSIREIDDERVQKELDHVVGDFKW